MKNTQRVLREGQYKADLARQRERHLTTRSVQIPKYDQVRIGPRLFREPYRRHLALPS